MPIASELLCTALIHVSNQLRQATSCGLLHELVFRRLSKKTGHRDMLSAGNDIYETDDEGNTISNMSIITLSLE